MAKLLDIISAVINLHKKHPGIGAILGQYVTSGTPNIDDEMKEAILKTITAKKKTKGIIYTPNIGKLEIELQHTSRSQDGNNLIFNKIYYINLQGKKHVIYDKKIHESPKQPKNP